MRKLSMDELNRKTVEEFRGSDKMPVMVVMDNIRSMHNVGSVFRTADAFLLEGIYLCGYTPQPPHRDIHKTALGATETVAWKYFPTTREAVESLKEDGYAVYAIEQAAGSIALNNAGSIAGKKLAVVFGNEVDGVNSDIIKMCDGCIEIPQLGMKHSLNISVAAGIVLWELVRPMLPESNEKYEDAEDEDIVSSPEHISDIFSRLAAGEGDLKNIKGMDGSLEQ